MAHPVRMEVRLGLQMRQANELAVPDWRALRAVILPKAPLDHPQRVGVVGGGDGRDRLLAGPAPPLDVVRVQPVAAEEETVTRDTLILSPHPQALAPFSCCAERRY